MGEGPEASWLAVGRVRRPHGIHGEIVVESLTDFPERLAAGVEIGLGIKAPDRRAVIHHARLHKGDFLLALEGICERNAVEPWRGLYVFLPEQPRGELPETYYYEHELLGCHCALVDGADVGEVTGLLPGAGGHLLAVATSRGEVLVPFTSPIVVRVDLATRTVVLDPPRGLFDADAL
ncbi:MAG: ribosome maturation factor RimM [Thermoanaerobaculales bacterium]